MNPADRLIGKSISHYKILSKIGEGGVGVVYKAFDAKLNRPVALKFLDNNLLKDNEIKIRFVQEARVAAVLDHPNVCTIFEINDTNMDHLFIAMAFYEGETLKERITQSQMNVDDIVDLAIQVANGLEDAHQKNIIHRDIKPANIFIKNDNTVKILDFGMAKLIGNRNLTKTGLALGTSAYMSPEQIEGGDIDQRTDIWSLGVVMYEMLTGKLPFDYQSETSLLYNIIHKTPTRPSIHTENIPSSLEFIILKALQKDRNQRYPTIKQFAKELMHFKENIFSDRIQSNKPRKHDSEWRLVTVLGIRLCDYHRIYIHMGQGEGSQFYHKVSKEMDSIVATVGGVIQKQADDSYTIFFGLHESNEMMPYLAIRTVLKVRNFFEKLDPPHSDSNNIEFACGIKTGHVVIDQNSSHDHNLIISGELLDIVIQIRNYARKRQILVDEVTYKMTKNTCLYHPVKKMKLSGYSKPISIYQYISDKNQYDDKQLNKPHTYRSELIGRDQELDRLYLHLLKVINGEGSVVNIIGEAGIGKTRLVSELQGKSETEKVIWLRGETSSIDYNLNYFLIADIIKKWVNIHETEDNQKILDKITNLLESYGANPIPEMLLCLLKILGIPQPKELRDQFYRIEGAPLTRFINRNLRSFFAAICLKKPIVLVLDDLHLIDPSSLEVLKSLYSLSEDHPILFINLFRPYYKTIELNILEIIKIHGPRNCTNLFLNSLNSLDSKRLIQNCFDIKQIPSHIYSMILERANGNPFFIEEIVQNFLDEGSEIKDREDLFSLSKFNHIEIPYSIQQIILTRIDQLETENINLLKIASIMGVQFHAKILQQVLPNFESIEKRLKHLEKIHIIIQENANHEHVYMFRHMIFRETIYESMIQSQREEFHHQVAEAIKIYFSKKIENYFGILAYHYCRAKDFVNATDYLIRSGEKALTASASSEALYYFQEALARYWETYQERIDPEKAGMLEKNIAIALYYKGKFDDCIQHFNLALNYYGYKVINTKLLKIFNMAIKLPLIILRLYLSVPKKRIPSSVEKDITNVLLRKSIVLFFKSPTDFVYTALNLISYIQKFYIQSLERGISIYATGSMLFSCSGLSFRISEKMLNYCQKSLPSGCFIKS